MVTIRQHSTAGELIDFNTLLPDVEAFCSVDEWVVQVDECIGIGAREIEAQTASEPAVLRPDELRAWYGGVLQTIDGSFIGVCQGEECCRLTAVDSSFWEVSGPPDFEAHMKGKYENQYGEGA
ncbi:hypothetical protein [Piscinibacterium candidicorallinum]|uniref:Uncharacterized protein n=1 Tax=Piscinibacterium candidicorallinum TaxID=1793872 RepID=A0ABV7H897_9BURK